MISRRRTLARLLAALCPALLCACAMHAGPGTMDRDHGAEVIPAKWTALPADIDPKSLSRLPLVRREDLDEQGRRAYDAVVDPASRLRAQLVGPAGIWLHIPQLSPHIREVNWHLRNRSVIPAGLAELAILVVTREMGGQTEWTAHEPPARKGGIAPEIIEIGRAHV